MKTINMGLNTEPAFTKADEIIERFKADNNTTMMDYWSRAKMRTLGLRDKIIEAVERDGEVELSWSCTGATLHSMLSYQWAQAMPQYKFEVGRYKCIVRKETVS